MKPLEGANRLVRSLLRTLLLTLGVGGAVLVAAGSVLVAQPPPPEPFVETVAVPRVLVGLVVWTKSGEPVLDLGPEEVRVLDDGEPVEILGSAAPSPRQRAPPPRRAGGVPRAS